MTRRRADEALYAAKSGGRNQVVVASTELASSGKFAPLGEPVVSGASSAVLPGPRSEAAGDSATR